MAYRDFDSCRSKSHYSEVVGPDEGGEEALTEYRLLKIFKLKKPVDPKVAAAIAAAARLHAATTGSSSCSSSSKNAGATAQQRGSSGKSGNSSSSKDFSYTQEFSFCRVKIHTGRTHQIR